MRKRTSCLLQPLHMYNFVDKFAHFNMQDSMSRHLIKSNFAKVQIAKSLNTLTCMMYFTGYPDKMQIWQNANGQNAKNDKMQIGQNAKSPKYK